VAAQGVDVVAGLAGRRRASPEPESPVGKRRAVSLTTAAVVAVVAAAAAAAAQLIHPARSRRA
jgi:hypothetical protein